MNSFAGNRRKLYSALILAGAEAFLSLILVGTWDYLTLISFLVLTIFVTISLRTQDVFYLKIQGALFNIFLSILLLVAWYFFHKALLLDTANKYGLEKFVALNPVLDKATIAEMFRVLSYQLPGWLILHSLLTIYAAANWSKWVWGFVRLPGLFIALMFAYGFALGAAINIAK